MRLIYNSMLRIGVSWKLILFAVTIATTSLLGTPGYGHLLPFLTFSLAVLVIGSFFNRRRRAGLQESDLEPAEVRFIGIFLRALMSFSLISLVWLDSLRGRNMAIGLSEVRIAVLFVLVATFLASAVFWSFDYHPKLLTSLDLDQKDQDRPPIA